MHLRTFGGLWIENGHVDAAVAPRRRPLALLALLAVAGQRGLSREKVVALLWPESDEERGRNSLSHALSAHRRDFGADLVIGAAELRLNADAITSDVEEFERSIAKGDRERATALYAGPFLDGFFLREAPDFERWAGEQRRRLHQLQVAALQRLAEEADGRNDIESAVASWRRLATLEPISPAAAIGLMKALAAAGDRAAALRHFQVHEAALRQELGVEAEDAVIALATRLRSESGIRMVTSPPNDNVTVVQHSSSDGSQVAVASGRDGAKSSQESGAEFSAGLSVVAEPKRRVASWFTFVIVAVLTGAAVTGFNAMRRTATRPLFNPRQVTVAGFANRTGDSTLDAFGFLAAEVITDALQRSGLVEVTDPGTSLMTVTGVRDLAVPLDDAKEMRLVGEATRAGLVVSGRFTREGDSLTIVARLADVAQGKVIATAEAVRVHFDAPASVLDHLKQRVVGLLAVRLDDRLRGVLTAGSTSQPTLPAYREYLAGMLRFQHDEYVAALPHFQRAYAIDSMFVAPLIWRVFACRNGNGGERCSELLRVLSGHRAQLSPLDVYVLDYLESLEANELAGQVAAAEHASRLAPGSIWSYALARGLSDEGRFAEAVTAFELIDRKFGWTRNWPSFWSSYSYVLERAGDRRRQLEIAREGRRAIPGSLELAYSEARVHTVSGTWAELEQHVTTMRTLPDPRAQLGLYLQIVAKLLRIRSDTLHARQVRDHAIAWYRARPAASETTGRRLEFAMALYDADNCAEARSRLGLLLEEQPRNSGALQVLALCHARLGERDAANQIISRLVAMAERDRNSFMQAARIAAVLGDRDRAVGFMKTYRDLGFYPHIDRAQMRDFASLVGYPPFVAVTQPR